MRCNVVNGIDVSKYVWLAKRVANRSRSAASGSLGIDDLRQAAMMGVVRAAEKFDDSKGVKFSTYAGIWAKKFVQNERFAMSDVVTVGKYGHQVLKVSEESDLGRAPEESHEWRVTGFSGDEAVDNSKELLSLSVLNDIDQAVLVSSYKLEMTDVQISKEMGVSQTRVQQIRKRALARARVVIESERGRYEQ